MERTPLHDLSRDELIGLILRLQKQLADLEKRNAELAARNEELARRFEECWLRYSRPVWRIINGQAVMVAYHIYAGPDGTVPQIPGVLKRCEFGQEISITLEHQFRLGVSLREGSHHPEVPGTNNESERSLRVAAQDRRTGRTSKTELGARRRTIIGSVLDSLRLHLLKPNLQAIQAEIPRWYDDGVSCFRRMVTSLKIPEPSLPPGVESILDQLVPLPDTG